MLPRIPRSTLFPYTTLFRSTLTSMAANLCGNSSRRTPRRCRAAAPGCTPRGIPRSEEHTSELQSHHDLVCRLLLEKKNKQHTPAHHQNQYHRTTPTATSDCL